MKVLIVGSGAREHAILKKVLESRLVSKVYCAPGNPGMALDAECVLIPTQDIDKLVAFAVDHQIDLTIVGPEQPLTLGIVDAFRAQNLKILGPDKKASILEGSKVFTKEFCQRHHIPTATFEVFDDSQAARAYLSRRNRYPVVIKADGLAAGKGVVIAKNVAEAQAALADMLVYEKFGTAGRKVVIEDFIAGEEASFIVVCDGKNFVEFISSQDHKAVFDDDKGPNTGGMGAYAPAPVVTDKIRSDVIERIIKPTLAGMEAEGRRYTGFLYAGLMITPQGEVCLLEYNCRLGDPETEVLMPMLESDFVELCRRAVDGELAGYQPTFYAGSAVCIVLASKGYPAEHETGQVISGLDARRDGDFFVYHAGTKMVDNQYLTSGGRVLVVAARGADLASTIKKVYHKMSNIGFNGMHFRKDIGKKGLS